jgi:hypothetical protein
MTGDFFHFAFGFFVVAFDLFFVHLSVLSMNRAITPARNAIPSAVGKKYARDGWRSVRQRT